MPRPFLVLVDQQAAAFAGDALERDLELRAAIAAQAVEHVAGQALRMDAHQRRGSPAEIAHLQHHGFFDAAIADRRPRNP